jgi:pimeloyl-ACP methyl ester carboxylesterase
MKLRIHSPLLSCLSFLAFTTLNTMAQTTPSNSYGDPLSANIPQTREELWSGIDMRAEPLDVEVLKEWEEDGVVLKVLRYRVGVFKGQKAMMAAVYGYPKGGSKLPGLVQIHGGGQFAQYEQVLANAKRGYATISIAWAGRIAAPGYHVNPDRVKLFWEGKKDDPNYKVTTDWGALDAYHAPTRNPAGDFTGVKPSEWSLDPIESPRNSPWFLATFAARRALTFLEQQPEVDSNRLGVYGHSMGGKISVLTAGSDDRVKAVAPSCGGISDRQNASPLFEKTITDNHYLKNISCPIFFLSPSNDFHGLINHLPAALHELKTREWRLTVSPHHNHQDTAEYEVATQVWMDRQLKGEGIVPETPWTQLNLKTSDGVPEFSIRPDAAKPVLGVEVYYTREGQMVGAKDDFQNTKNRFWYYAPAQKEGGVWKAKLPLCGLEKPLWVYANVIYGLDKPIQGAGYYARSYSSDRFVISSPPNMVAAKLLQAAGVKATRQPSLLIEDFEGDWKKQWFAYKPEEWAISTHKIYTEEWKAPPGSQLALEVRAEQPNKMVVALSDSAAEVVLQGGADWQTVLLNPANFLNAANEPLTDWSTIKELRLGAQETLRGKSTKELGGKWQGAPPEFRNLRWVVGS